MGYRRRKKVSEAALIVCAKSARSGVRLPPPFFPSKSHWVFPTTPATHSLMDERRTAQEKKDAEQVVQTHWLSRILATTTGSVTVTVSQWKELAASKDALAAASKQNKSLAVDNASLRVQCASVRARGDNLEKAYRELWAHNDTVEKQLAAVKAEALVLTADAQNAKLALKTALSTVTALQAKQKELEGVIGTKDNELRILTAKTKELVVMRQTMRTEQATQLKEERKKYLALESLLTDCKKKKKAKDEPAKALKAKEKEYAEQLEAMKWVCAQDPHARAPTLLLREMCWQADLCQVALSRCALLRKYNDRLVKERDQLVEQQQQLLACAGEELNRVYDEFGMAREEKKEEPVNGGSKTIVETEANVSIDQLPPYTLPPPPTRLPGVV